MRADFTPRSEAEKERSRLASRSESLRMVVYGVLFLFAVYFVFFTPSSGPRDPDADAPMVALPNVPQRRGTDAAVARDTLERLAQEERGEVASVRSERFSLDPAVFEGIDDAQLDVVEEPAFYQLVAQLHGMSEEELVRAQETHGSFTWEQLHKPDGSGLRAARGKFITIHGRFHIRPWQRVLARYPNEAGLAWVWQGLFRHQNRGYFVTITDKDFEPDVGPNGTALELTGAFLRIYRYKAEASDEDPDPIKELPHIVVKSLRRLPTGSMDVRQRTPRAVVYVFGGMLLLATISVAIYGWVSRRSMAKIDDWRRGAQRRRLEKGLHGVDPPGAPHAPDAPGGSQEPGQPATPEAAAGAALTGAGPAQAPSPSAPAVVAAPVCPVYVLEISGAETVVCAGCLRRHHRACWVSRCGVCGGAEGLVPLAGAPPAA